MNLMMMNLFPQVLRGGLVIKDQPEE